MKLIKFKIKMKPKNMPRLINQQDNIKTLIIHFNVDKTIIMRDSLSYDNSDVIVSIIIDNNIIIF